MPLITWLVISGGWRISFYALAAIGIIPACFFYLYVYDDPSKNPKISQEELDYIGNGMPETKPLTAGGFGFLKDKSFWLNSIVYAAIMAGYWGFMGWVPSYLSKTLGFTFAKMGLIASLPYIAGTIAVFAITPIMDRYRASAAISVICCAGFGLLLFMSMFVSDKTVAVALLVASAVFLMPVFPAVFTILQSISKPREIANATGVFNGISFTFSAFFPYLIGAIYTATGDLRNGFYLLVGVMAIGALGGHTSHKAPVLTRIGGSRQIDRELQPYSRKARKSGTADYGPWFNRSPTPHGAQKTMRFKGHFWVRGACATCYRPRDIALGETAAPYYYKLPTGGYGCSKPFPNCSLICRQF